jgi:Mg-chelatase subunit ChlD
MAWKRFLIFIGWMVSLSPAYAQLQYNEQELQLGTIAEATEIKGDLVLRNSSDKKVYLMRADADREVKVYAAKKTLQPGDTTLLVISFKPESSGKFKKAIRLVASDRSEPYELELNGTILKVKRNDLDACYYFGQRRSPGRTVEEPIVVNEPPRQRDNSNRMPDNTQSPSPPAVSPKKEEPPAKPSPVEKSSESAELSRLEYRPNNILFLVDVSGSMKDSMKLPLMKEALHVLIDAVRDIDRISFVTYADSVKVISEGISGADKESLHHTVNGLKAHGLTRGNKAILFSQQLAQKHFITEGNNQVFLSTDGKFRFYPDDVKKWKERQVDGRIVLSTVAFGTDREAIKNLKEIADNGGGSFIHIKKRNGAKEKLLEEVKGRSRRR